LTFTADEVGRGGGGWVAGGGGEIGVR
jgi:hypothetical protein